MAEWWQSCLMLKTNARIWMWDIRVNLELCWSVVPTSRGLCLKCSDNTWHFSKKRISPSQQINISLLLYNIALYNIQRNEKCSLTRKSGWIHLQFNGKEIDFFFNFEDNWCKAVIWRSVRAVSIQYCSSSNSAGLRTGSIYIIL